MKKILSLAFLNFKQGMREKLFWGVVFFFISFLALCVLLGKLSPGASGKVLRDAGLAGVELTALVLIVFSLIIGFYREKDSRSLEIYLSNFSRPVYLGGKLIGYLLICFSYLVLAGTGYILLLLFHNAFLLPLVAGLYSLFLKVSIVIAFSLVFCCVFSSPLIALLSTLFIYFASEMAYPALKILTLGADKFKAAGFKFLYYLLPNMDKLDIKSLVVYGKMPPVSFFLLASLYTIVYILFLWLIARFIFIRKEY